MSGEIINFRVNLDGWADDSPGAAATDADWSITGESRFGDLLDHVELTAAQKAQLLADGQIAVCGVLLTLADVDPTQRELDWAFDDGMELKR